eukprot:SAG11_NODE_3470_length_2429_cov_3.351073_2_plen_186_part_00
MFTSLGDFSFLEIATHYALPEWDVPSPGIEAAALTVQIVFFVLTVVILMNLLIAMMSQTYTKIHHVAQQEYRMVRLSYFLGDSSSVLGSCCGSITFFTFPSVVLMTCVAGILKRERGVKAYMYRVWRWIPPLCSHCCKMQGFTKIVKEYFFGASNSAAALAPMHQSNSLSFSTFGCLIVAALQLQ